MPKLNCITWNLEKRGLVSFATQPDVDIALLQEYDSTYRTDLYESHEAISFDTYGTAILSRIKPVRVSEVSSPHGDFRLKFWLGMVYKATAIATFENGLTAVSFHGYNGTLRGRRPEMLRDHINAVLDAIPNSGPCVFAGDFNTFTAEHHQVVDEIMHTHSFQKAINVPYNDYYILDLVYVRNCNAQMTLSEHHESDHPFIKFTLDF
jgi:endonuclease/exonuclease/phosphatase family metal-dependent hydrolase